MSSGKSGPRKERSGMRTTAGETRTVPETDPVVCRLLPRPLGHAGEMTGRTWAHHQLVTDETVLRLHEPETLKCGSGMIGPGHRLSGRNAHPRDHPGAILAISAQHETGPCLLADPVHQSGAVTLVHPSEGVTRVRHRVPVRGLPLVPCLHALLPVGTGAVALHLPLLPGSLVLPFPLQRTPVIWVLLVLEAVVISRLISNKGPLCQGLVGTDL